MQVEKPATADLSSEGLGRLPNNTDSISSLLLFNTSENPYVYKIVLKICFSVICLQTAGLFFDYDVYGAIMH